MICENDIVEPRFDVYVVTLPSSFLVKFYP